MIRPYLTDDAVWVRHQGTDQWGEPSLPVEQPIKTRIQYRLRVVRDSRGQEAVSSAKLMVLDRPGPSDRYRFDDRLHGIIQIHRRASFDASHYEVFVAPPTAARTASR